MSIGIMTGDIKFNPEADCIIMTTEILRNLLYKKDTNNKNDLLDKTLSIDIDINDIDSVIFDEVHYINDIDRGKVWEESIILLPKRIKLIMLSATIDKAEHFAEWIQNMKGITVNLIPCSTRVIPLRHYFYVLAKIPKSKKFPDKLYLTNINKYSKKMIEIVNDKCEYNYKNFDDITSFMNSYNKYNYRRLSPHYLINTLVEYLFKSGKTPCLFFVFSRKKCLSYAKMIQISLNNISEQAEVEKIIDFQIERLENPSIYKNSSQIFTLKNLLTKGIAIHHSGLIPVFKEIIEILFSKGLVKVLFATETFAVGVNMPTKTVIFTGLTKYDSHTGHRYLKTHEYLQMSGRAGRRGLDTHGIVILLPNMFNELPSRETSVKMMTGKSQNITSKFKLNYQFLLKVLLTDDAELNIFINKTLLNKEFIEIKDEYIKELSEIEKYLEKRPETNYSDEQFDDYFYLVNPNEKNIFGNGQITFKIKSSKKTKKRIQQYEQMDNFVKDYHIYCDFYNYIIKYNKLKENIKHYDTIINKDLINVLTYLKYHGYIHCQDIDIDTLNYDNMTRKGIIASQINECNELLFTEILVSGILDDLTTLELVGILSLFTEARPLDDNNVIYNPDSLDVSIDMIKKIKKIIEISKKLENDENSYNIDSDSKWNINLNMVKCSMQWAEGKDLKDIEFDNFEGNFIREIIKIGKISEDLVIMSELLEKLELMSKASKIEGLIIRDIVTVDSLYIKN